MSNGRARSSPADAPVGAGTLTGTGSGALRDGPGDAGTGRAEQALWRRRLRHDIRHELGTIIMLASAVVVADDIGDTSRGRVEQLLGETRWLDHLLRRLDDDDDRDRDDGRALPAPERIRVDDLTAEVVTGMRLATPHEVCFTGGEAWAHMDPVALWRAVRNVLDNACRVAEARVSVRVETDQGWIAVQVDDDGPGFGADRGTHRPGLASLGLGIVHDLISGYGGSLEIRTCEMGGARVRMLLPAAPPPDPRADDWRPHR
ncbi:ATP-binding protein [Actinomadura sp. 6K520]|uniref:sensor histidine kinase n=1 Tax=Actinomadura sp. 6K520 TaxID=2530364 RepID=UPI001043FC82|nr:ATP-binding protein [Actinomadura sp. 6K520]TDE23949.1 sensor histidine kinase [Actinomadura sp. 6K520]